MASQGYVVVAPNRRGCPSFGSEWREQISGDYAGQNIQDYLAAIDTVAKEPWCDTEHMGCVGADDALRDRLRRRAACGREASAHRRAAGDRCAVADKVPLWAISGRYAAVPVAADPGNGKPGRAALQPVKGIQKGFGGYIPWHCCRYGIHL